MVPYVNGKLEGEYAKFLVNGQPDWRGQFGEPETFVSARKKELFRLAATHLQEELDWRGDIRFDILALTLFSAGFRIEHFEDAFY